MSRLTDWDLAGTVVNIAKREKRKLIEVGFEPTHLTILERPDFVWVRDIS